MAMTEPKLSDSDAMLMKNTSLHEQEDVSCGGNSAIVLVWKMTAVAVDVPILS